MTPDDTRPDPAVETFIAASAAVFTVEFDRLPIGEQRAIYDDFWRRYHAPRPEGVSMEEMLLPGPSGILRALLYRPAHIHGALPAVLYLHGGGWIFGSPESHDIAASRLCAQAGVAVLSLDYRLAPEHPYPDALMDCVAVLTWLAAEAGRIGVDAARLGVAGDSAGGNLAAALCLWVRDHGGPAIRFQALIYPFLVCDVGGGCSADVSPESVTQYLAAYLGGRGLCDEAYAMPLSAKSLRNLPPAYIATAALDPIEFHGARYVVRLRHDAITCDYSCDFGLPHTYLRLLHLSWRAAAAFDRVCQAVRRGLA